MGFKLTLFFYILKTLEVSMRCKNKLSNLYFYLINKNLIIQQKLNIVISGQGWFILENYLWNFKALL